MRRLGLAVGLLWLAAAGTGRAAEPSVGRWAADPARCEAWGGDSAATAPLTVYDTGLNWFPGYCRFGKVYKAGQALYIQAHCWGGGDVPVTLDARGDRMKVTWNRDKPQELRRCK
jgi:hypothetical protein